MRKRLLSILLSLAMVTGLLPTAAAVGAFAADEQPIMVNNYDELVAAVIQSNWEQERTHYTTRARTSKIRI